eukprot:c19179_g1_i1.p1 GENE.c19179_g1_i1~~c19179_g1_i1.p1  ORF type:complete len:278 (+),score=70.01 c19179_g1_i1:244-1077(+)
MARVDAAQEVSSLEMFWLAMGMEPRPSMDMPTLAAHVHNFAKYVADRHQTKWKVATPSPPPTREVVDMLKTFAGKAQVGSESDVIEAEKEEERQRILHSGYPALPPDGKLPIATCLYCNTKFRHRDLLFRHLKHYIGPGRMVHGYHRQHMTTKAKDLQAVLDTEGPYVCPVCNVEFPSRAALGVHYEDVGHPSFRTQKAVKKALQGQSEEPKAEEAELLTTPYDQFDACLVCNKYPRSALTLPSGFIGTCMTCGRVRQTCIVSGRVVSDVLEINDLQ